MPRLPETAYFPLAPEWLCEVVSRSTAAVDRTKKLTIYAREGVRHVWLIDPTARTLEILGLRDRQWVIGATHAGGEIERAQPFDVIELDLAVLWEEPAAADVP
jgi:Uma2 family endonuclease